MARQRSSTSRTRRSSDGGSAPPTESILENPSKTEVPRSASFASQDLWTRILGWLRDHRVELALFGLSYFLLAGFSGERFLRQSAAPHFVYQSKAWLSGRLDIDPGVLPNLEDWACVRDVNGAKRRCESAILPSDKWYVSFPPFPALVMAPFVAVNGYQFNDTSFGVFIGALAVALFYGLLRMLAQQNGLQRSTAENTALALLLGFGTLFFYCAIRGEVWFSAEVMGVALTCLYLRCAVQARRPVWAGMFFSMATLTRTPLLFTGLFFAVEAFAVDRNWKSALRKLGQFAAGAAPLAVAAALYNLHRFGSVSEFGHAFLYNNRVNADIDRFGLFNLVYLARNLKAAFFFLPQIRLSPLSFGYNPHGLSLLLTLPLTAFLFVPVGWGRLGTKRWALVAAAAILGWAFVVQLFPQAPLAELFALPPAQGDFFPAQISLPMFGMLGAVALPVATGLWLSRGGGARLSWPLWVTVAATALPGLLYQNDGFAQFGFRFSLDYTPYLLLLFAISRWSLKNRWVLAACALGVLVNFWGAVSFRGYTELMRGG